MHLSTSPHSTSAGPSSWLRLLAAKPGGERSVLDLGRLLLGLTVVALGVLYLLDAAGALNADRAIDRWWPVLIVAAGLLTIAERPPSMLRGTLLTLGGGVALLFTTRLLDENGWDYVAPALLIAAGAVIVARWHGLTIPAGASDEDVVRSTAIFGTPKIVCTARGFQGAWLTAVFGGVTLDLRDARIGPTGASINATAGCGGVHVLVPKGWRISVRSTPILGSMKDRTDHSVPVPDDAPTLHLDAVTVLGSVEIKHE